MTKSASLLSGCSTDTESAVLVHAELQGVSIAHGQGWIDESLHSRDANVVIFTELTSSALLSIEVSESSCVTEVTRWARQWDVRA